MWRRVLSLLGIIVGVQGVANAQALEYRVEWRSQQRVSLLPLQETLKSQLPRADVSVQNSELDITLQWEGRLRVYWLEIPKSVYAYLGVSSDTRAVLMELRLVSEKISISSGTEQASESELERLKNSWRRSVLYVLWVDGKIAGAWAFADDAIVVGILTHFAYWLSPDHSSAVKYDSEELDMYGQVLTSIEQLNEAEGRRVLKRPIRYSPPATDNHAILSVAPSTLLTQVYKRESWMPHRISAQGHWTQRFQGQFAADVTVHASAERLLSLQDTQHLWWAILRVSQLKPAPLFEVAQHVATRQSVRYTWRNFSEAIESLKEVSDHTERYNRLTALTEYFTEQPLWCAEAQKWLESEGLDTPIAMDVLTALRDARSVAAQRALVGVADSARAEEQWKDYETVVINMSSVRLVSPLLLDWLFARVESANVQERVTAYLTLGSVASTLYEQGSQADAIRAVRRLRELLSQARDSSEQRVLLAALGNSRLPVIREWVLPYTYSEDVLTRAAALNALCGIEDDEAETRLLEAFADVSEQVRLLAIRCFQQRVLSERVIQNLLSNWSSEWSPAFRREAVQAISRMGDKQRAIAVLEEIVRSEKDESVRLFALSALEVIKENRR